MQALSARTAAFAGVRASNVSNRTQVRCSARKDGALSWCPGIEIPAYLDGTLPGDFGFDPARFGSTPANLARFREAELMNGRWAMLGSAGIIGVEALGYGNWLDAAEWPVSGAPITYFGNPVPFDIPTLTAIEFVALAFVESARGAETDGIKRCYPGGAFDPLGLSKDAKGFEEYKLKEVKNGRLAMLSMLGYWGQAVSTGKSPLTNLADHCKDPFHVNVTINPIALPFL